MSPAGERRPRRFATLSRKLALAAAITMLALTVMEGLARLFVPLRRPPPFQATEAGLDLMPGFQGLYAGARVRTNALGLRDAELGEPRGDELRVLCLGDSNTFGLSLPEEAAYPRRAEAFLQQVLRRPVRVLNGGIPGADTRNGLELLRRLLPVFRPQVVTFAFGFNGRQLARGPQHAPPLWVRIDAWLFRHSAMYAAAVNAWSRFGWTVSLVPEDQEALPFDRLPVRVTPEEHAELLRQGIEAARAAGAKVMLIEMEENPILLGPLRRSVACLERGDIRGASAALAHYSALERNPGHDYYAPVTSDLERRIAAAQGQVIPAYRVQRRAPFYLARFPDPYLQASRDLASSLDVPVVRLKTLAWHRRNAFLDVCHFDAEMHDELGRALAEELLKLLGGPRGPRTTP